MSQCHALVDNIGE